MKKPEANLSHSIQQSETYRLLVRIVKTANGSTARTISGTYTHAVVQGEELHLTQTNGKIRVVNINNGSTIRIF